MEPFTEGDRVRVDIPDETDPEHDRFHGEHGTIVDVFEDQIEELTGDVRDSKIFRVELETEEIVDFRRRDLRPPLD